MVIDGTDNQRDGFDQEYRIDTEQVLLNCAHLVPNDIQNQGAEEQQVTQGVKAGSQVAFTMQSASQKSIQCIGDAADDDDPEQDSGLLGNEEHAERQYDS
jgi:hypothetical protein